MVGIDMLRLVACRLQKFNVDLKRCVRQFAQELRLSHDFGWHQVQDQNVKWTDVLVHCAELRHDKYIFTFQNRSSR